MKQREAEVWLFERYVDFGLCSDFAKWNSYFILKLEGSDNSLAMPLALR